MNIAIWGYGKMGKMIEKLAKERGHTISLIITHETAANLSVDDLAGIDVVIEFTIPEKGYEHVRKCIQWGKPVISGTTGWSDKWPEIEALAIQNKIGVICASNFSLGVNIFFELNKKLAQYMAPHASYIASMEEIHHTAKKDSPSGTAITLAEGIIENTSYSHWVNDKAGHKDALLITSKRIDPAPGTHIIHYKSDIDTISIAHEAHSREGFALGAVVAAEWIVDKEGFYSMRDVLGL